MEWYHTQDSLQSLWGIEFFLEVCKVCVLGVSVLLEFYGILFCLGKIQLFK